MSKKYLANENGETINILNLITGVKRVQLSSKDYDEILPNDSIVYLVDVSDCNRLTVFTNTTNAIDLSIRAYDEIIDGYTWDSIDKQYISGRNVSCQAHVGGLSKVAVVLVNKDTSNSNYVFVSAYKSIL